jgi:hypothetical protein
MPSLTYLNFVLVLEKAPKGYRAAVLDSPAGQAETTFKIPFTRKDLEIYNLRVGQARKGMRRVNSPEMELARDYGRRLFEAVFTGDVYAGFRLSSDQARLEGKGLRLQLRIKDARLASLPWEYLYNPGLNRFLSQGNDTPVVRCIDIPEPVRPLEAALPLKVLVVIANPRDLPLLDTEGEWQRLNSSLAPLVARCQVKVERLEKPCLEALQMRLRSGGPYHVLHFVGHGAFDEQNQDGLLVFEAANGAVQMVNGQRLGTILHNHPSLRLAVLNACEGGRTSQEDPFAGVAQSLVQQGLPAVIAMQYPITDGAALTFAREFYAALADGFSLDAALAEARVAIFASGNDIEWGTPILFMRSPDQNLFDFEKASSSEKPTIGQAPPKASRGRTHWSRWGGFAILLGLLVVVLVMGLLKPVIFPPTPSPTLLIPSPTFTSTSTSSPEPSWTPTLPEPTSTPTPSPTETFTPTTSPTETLSTTPTPTMTASPELTSTPTFTSTTTPTQTLTPTSTPRPILPYQVRQRITQEAALEMTKNPSESAMDALYWEGAQVSDASTGQQWSYRDYYSQASTTLTEYRHENLSIVEFTSPSLALFSDACYLEKEQGNDEVPRGTILGTKWQFELRDGLWKIAALSINNQPPASTTYTFEDGSLGCWQIGSEAGSALGLRLVNSTDLAHDGIRSLDLDLDLAQPPLEPRARLEHLTSQPLGGIQKLSAWVYIFPEAQPAALEVQFFVVSTSGTRSLSATQVIQTGAWNYLEASIFYPDASQASTQKIGLEVRLPANSELAEFQGIAFVDKFRIDGAP